jgi:hypothetical protein
MSKYKHENLSKYIKQDAKSIKKNLDHKENISDILNTISTFFGYRHYHELKSNDNKINESDFVNLSELSFLQLLIIKKEYKDFILNNYSISDFSNSIKKINQLTNYYFNTPIGEKRLNNYKSKMEKKEIERKNLYSSDFFSTVIEPDKPIKGSFTVSHFSWEENLTKYKDEDLENDYKKIENLIFGIGKNKVLLSSFNYFALKRNNITNIKTVEQLFYSESNVFFHNENIINTHHLNDKSELVNSDLYSLNSFIYFEMLTHIKKYAFCISKKEDINNSKNKDIITRFSILKLFNEMKEVLKEIKYYKNFAIENKIWKQETKYEDDDFITNIYIMSNESAMRKITFDNFSEDLNNNLEDSTKYLDEILKKEKINISKIMNYKYNTIKSKYINKKISDIDVNTKKIINDIDFYNNYSLIRI